MPLLISSLSVVAFALILPFTIIGSWFQFTQPPITFLLILAVFVGTYLALVEAVKTLFYRRHAQKLEKIPIPPRRITYMTPMARSIQSIVAVICLRPEGEITIDSLVSDLRKVSTYPTDPDQINIGLHSLRHAGLVSIDWRKGLIKRQTAMRNYVDKLAKMETWSKTKDEWRATGSLIQARYGKVNPEYEKLLD